MHHVKIFETQGLSTLNLSFTNIVMRIDASYGWPSRNDIYLGCKCYKAKSRKKFKNRLSTQDVTRVKKKIIFNSIKNFVYYFTTHSAYFSTFSNTFSQILIFL